MVMSGCGLIGQQGQSPPEHGKPLVGVSYRLTADCPEAFQIGDWLWKFRSTDSWPPPVPGTRTFPRDPAPGVLTLTSETEGMFVADTNSVAYEVVRVRETDGTDWLCPGV